MNISGRGVLPFLHQSGTRNSRQYIVLCAVAVLSGGLIYILFHASEPLFFRWMRAAGTDHWLGFIRNKSLSLGTHLPEWIVYSLPGGLWAFAYALMITAIWSGSRSLLKIFWMASIPLLVFGSEFLQFLQIIPGTFCLQDIALGTAGMISGIALIYFKTKSIDYEKATS